MIHNYVVGEERAMQMHTGGKSRMNEAVAAAAQVEMHPLIADREEI